MGNLKVTVVRLVSLERRFPLYYYITVQGFRGRSSALAVRMCSRSAYGIRAPLLQLRVCNKTLRPASGSECERLEIAAGGLRRDFQAEAGLQVLQVEKVHAANKFYRTLKLQV